MGLTRDLFSLGGYFLLLSAVIQAEDAFVYYYDQQNSSSLSAKVKQHRVAYLIVVSLFGLINLTTLFLAPFFNITTKKLAIGACAILLFKYVCELATYMNFVKPIFELSSIFADIIGESLFYLTTFRLLQIIIEKNDAADKTGRCYGFIAATFAFSLMTGYSFGYLCYEKMPTWLFLIILTCATVIAGVIAYFTFMFEPPQPVLELHQEQSEGENAAAQRAEQRRRNEQIYRNGMTYRDIFNTMLKIFLKMLPIMPIQIVFGLSVGFAFDLLKFLEWTSQESTIYSKLKHTMIIMVFYTAFGSLGGGLGGYLIDRLSLKKIGLGILVYTIFNLIFLYFAIWMRTFVSTLLLYAFLGQNHIAVLTWLFTVCSRIYGGSFEVLTANVIVIVLSINTYSLWNTFFQEKISDMVKFCLGLAVLILLSVFAYFPFKKVPENRVVIEFEEANLEQSGAPAAGTGGEQTDRREGEVEMSEKVEAQLEKRQEGLDPEVLI